MLAKAFIRNESGVQVTRITKWNSDLPLAYRLAWRANNSLDYQEEAKRMKLHVVASPAKRVHTILWPRKHTGTNKYP